MTNPVVLDIMGQPTTQGSKSAIVRGGRAVMVEGRGTEARRRFADWRHAVRSEAQRAVEEGARCVDGPVSVALAFRLPRPKSLPKWRWLPWTKPDLDKLARCVLDGLTGVLISDDARVVALAASKDYALDGEATGCKVVVCAIEERAV